MEILCAAQIGHYLPHPGLYVDRPLPGVKELLHGAPSAFDSSACAASYNLPTNGDRVMISESGITAAM